MPNFDRKGPNGKGSKTGRGLGKCGSNENNNTDYGKRNGNGAKHGRRNGGGSGSGCGNGRGRGWNQ